MKTITVFTWGYSKRTPEDLLFYMVNVVGLGGHIIDVRARPQSRWRPEWSRNPLRERFGSRYIWAECFGNAEKADPAEWRPAHSLDMWNAPALAAVIRSGMLGNVLLLCLEQDPAKCHRSAVAEFIGLPTVHLGWPEAQG